MDSYQYKSNNKQIYFLLADITDLKVDVIVNFVSHNLSNTNRLNDAILNKGGNSVEIMLKKKWSQSMKLYLSTIITTGGDLPCKNIIHTLSICNKPNNLGYYEAIKEKFDLCLRKAAGEHFKSFAFPIMYPENIDKIYCKSLNAVLSSYQEAFPKEIYCVCKDKGKFETLIKLLNSQLTPRKSPRVLYDDPLASNRRQNLTTPPNAPSNESFFQGNNVRMPKFQNNSSQMASELGAMGGAAAEPTPMDTSTSEPTDSNDSCPICLSDFTDRKTLEKCDHSFCSACIDQSFASVGPSCPICQTVYGKVIGLQPPGTMTVEREGRSVPGFPNCGMYVLQYDIPNGIQKKEHPNPGKRFSGAWRTGVLPANHKGEIVLKMLQRAFLQKLIFTVGISRTTNQKDTVTWNDIHHKTSIDGGPFNFGYPDDNYLNRVMSELEAKGIDAKSVADEEIVYVLKST